MFNFTNTHKNIKWFLLVLCWFAQISFPSCDKCKDCGTGTFAYNASHCKLFLSTSSSGNSSIKAEEYVINARIFMSEVRGQCLQTERKRQSTGYLYATSPARPVLDTLLDSITSIEVIDILGYNDPSDSIITNKILVFNASSIFKDTLNASAFKTTNFLEDAEYFSSVKFELKPDEMPSREKWHQFKLRIYLSDNRILEEQTDSVFLNL